MLTFRRPQLISRSIESVVSQNSQDWELLVVHDGPDMETVRVMQEWQRREPRIRYFRRGITGNIAEATNFGIRQARGEYIAILDDDDVWVRPDKLIRQAAFLDAHPDYAACGGGLIVVDSTGREKMRYLRPSTDEAIKRGCLYANPMAHSVTMYRRCLALEVGGYDESLPGFQDWELWLKLGLRAKLYNFPEHFGTYLIWEGGGSFFQRRGNTKSALRIVWRYRRHYRGFPFALLAAAAYYVYSLLPDWILRRTFPFLSRLKKQLTAGRTAGKPEESR